MSIVAVRYPRTLFFVLCVVVNVSTKGGQVGGDEIEEGLFLFDVGGGWTFVLGE